MSNFWKINITYITAITIIVLIIIVVTINIPNVAITFGYWSTII